MTAHWAAKCCDWPDTFCTVALSLCLILRRLRQEVHKFMASTGVLDSVYVNLSQARVIWERILIKKMLL